MTIDLSAIGMTQEEAQERLIVKLVERFCGLANREEGGYVEDRIWNTFNEQSQKMLNNIIVKLVEEKVAPILVEKVDTLILQPTNRWGEKKKEQLSLVEYLTQVGAEYLTEEVNKEGDKKGYGDKQPRICQLLHSGLQKDIQDAVKNCVIGINKTLAETITEVIKNQLEQMLKTVKVAVTQK